MTTTDRVQAHRRRKKEGYILLHFEISQALTDNLVDATKFLGEWDTEDPKAIANAIIKHLEQLGNDVSD